MFPKRPCEATTDPLVSNEYTLLHLQVTDEKKLGLIRTSGRMQSGELACPKR